MLYQRIRLGEVVKPNILLPLGKSFPRIVCQNQSLDEKKQSINLYGTSPAFKAESVAHEIGHNLGMSHDFNWRHGGTGCAFRLGSSGYVSGMVAWPLVILITQFTLKLSDLLTQKNIPSLILP